MGGSMFTSATELAGMAKNKLKRKRKVDTLPCANLAKFTHHSEV